MSRTLTITPIVFKSSRLAIPLSPTSPKTAELQTGFVQIENIRTSMGRTGELPDLAPPPPPKPLPWLWQCHICSRIYPLATTRRCLDDGHRFCSGTTVVKRSKKTGKKIVQHKACASEFDYGGWRSYGDWRRALADSDFPALERTSKVAAVQRKHDCWNSCNYPSECRWGHNLKIPTLHVDDPIPLILAAKKEKSMAGEVDKQAAEDELIDLDTIAPCNSIDGLRSQHAVETTDVKPQTDEEPISSEDSRKRGPNKQSPDPLELSTAPSTRSGACLPPTASKNEDLLQAATADLEADMRSTIKKAGELLNRLVGATR